MPSVKNPNTVSRNRQIAHSAKARKQSRKSLALSQLPSRVAKADARRGARTGLLPTSGPNAALSAKKARKVEKQLAHAIRRKAEADAAREAAAHEADEAAKSKKEFKADRNAALEALGKMDIA